MGRPAILILLVSLLLLQAGPPIEYTPWNQMELSLSRLGGEKISYRGFYFLPDDGPGDDRLQRWLKQGEPPRWEASARLINMGNDPAIRVLQVAGEDHRACWQALQQEFAAGKSPAGPVVWMAEVFLEGGYSDLSSLAESLLAGLAGSSHSIYRDEFTINILAYAPGFKEELIMEGVPVNLNLELRYNRERGEIRIRAGVPLLV